MLSLRTTIQTAIGACALSLLALSGTAQAQDMRGYGPSHGAQQGAYVNVQFGAPPPARYEAAPAPRRGYVWAPGYWQPRGHRHAWVAGHWVRARPGYVYRQPAWNHQGDRWNLAPGRWDRDGDGVPNRHDRNPNNPYRR